MICKLIINFTHHESQYKINNTKKILKVNNWEYYEIKKERRKIFIICTMCQKKTAFACFVKQPEDI